MSFFKYAPAFIVNPNDEDVSAREAFLFSDNWAFSLSLAPMDGTSSPHVWNDADKPIGFDPIESLTNGWADDGTDAHDGNDALYLELFNVSKWARMGRPPVKINPETDSEGRELLPWSRLDFEHVPMKFVPKDALSMWLAVRGIRKKELKTRGEFIEVVKTIYNNGQETVPPRPAMLLRGAAGYVEYEVLQPRGEGPVAMATGDNALKLIRDSRLPKIDDEYFSTVFGIQQSSRVRCLLHVKGGSFDLHQLKVTMNLKSRLHPEKLLFVVTACCAPSQKLTDGKLYNITITFEVLPTGEFRFLREFHTYCNCPAKRSIVRSVHTKEHCCSSCLASSSIRTSTLLRWCGCSHNQFTR